LLPFAQDLPTTGTMLDGAVTNISLWSYSLYLSHPAILYLAYHFTDPVIHSFSGKALVKLACLTLSFLISKLTFQYFETPIMNLRDRTPNRRALPSAELVSGD
jgi:peptidoglycan/LPS O-acetylase OafA/YrhL